MSGGKIALLVAGIALALIGFGVGAAGAGILWAHGTQRGPDGYLESPTWTLEADGAAVTAEEIDLGAPTPGDWLWAPAFDVRFTVESVQPVFMGVAPRASVEEYLRDVAHSEIARLGPIGGDVTYRARPGGSVPAPPGEQTFWTAQTEGPGLQQLNWRAEPGTWAIVVMNADGQYGVSVQASAATQADFLLPLGTGLAIGAFVLLLAAAAMIVAAAASTRTTPTGAATPGATAPGVPAAAARRPYPVAIEGRLDEPLSRWLWLVKWVLLIPHFVVLTFLWLAFVLLTAVAGVAILFTRRYPRGIFEFNVGVIRWTWRVTYYGYAALGTDRYPPFTLEPVDYPAMFDVAYPQQLSRGLVLVKWWLLAIPHYLIVGLLVGGGVAWQAGNETWGQWLFGAGTGVIGVLVFVGGIVLLFRATYPRGLFDIVMGLDRWVYRVLAYAALMTDEYPPFRLDLGGEEPQPAPPHPPIPPPPAAKAELVQN